MAEVKNIQINVDTKGATKAMDDLAKATHDVSASFEEVYGDLQPLTTRMGEAEDRLYELANAGQTATQEYQDLLKTVGNYRKVQIQTDMAVDAAATTMAQKLGGALNGAAAGFSLVQGVMGTFGAESEQVEKLMLRVQSAMAISQGVQGVREAIPAITAFGTAIKTQAITALTTLKGALITTGIGALVVALGFAANAMGMFGDSTEDAEEQQKKLDDQLEKTNKRLESQRELTEKVSLTIDNRVRQEIANAKKRGASQAELDKIELEGSKDRLETLKREEEAYRKVYLQKSKSGSTKEFEAAEKAYLESAQRVTEQRLAIEEKEADIQYQRIEKRREQLKEQQELEEKSFKATVKAFDESVIDMDEGWTDWNNQKAAQREKEIEEQKAYDQSILDAQVQLQQDLTDAAIQGAADRVNAALAEQQQKEAIQMQNIEFALQGIAIVKDLFENSKGVQKAAIIAESAMGIAKMIISNKTANLGALATPQAIATSGLSAAPVIAANNISTGLGIAANVAATAKALRALGGGSAPSAGGVGGGSISGGGSASMSPSFNVVGNSGMNQLAQIQQTPVQAFVVSGEVTSAQALDRNRIKNATL